MLEVVSLMFKGAEIRKEADVIPESIEVSVSVDGVEQDGDDAVILYWSYNVDYRPNAANVKINGEARCTATPDAIRKFIKEFEETKQFPLVDGGAEVLNMINANASINAIFLIRPFNLMPPFTPPLIESK
ncbi:MAG: hypothetical protein V1827_06265 [Candidatus Micrarchaeota archaeon]